MTIASTPRRTAKELVRPLERVSRRIGGRLPARVLAGIRRRLPRRATAPLDADALSVIAEPEATYALCPLCGTRAKAFLPFGIKAKRDDCRCPTCGSLERHRLIWLYFALRTDLLRSGARFLHIAPEPAIAERIRRISGIRYVSGDLEPGRAMVQMDITAIDLPDDSFDVIYASHVLEHIPDDVAAMSELRRVLSPHGWAILEVPIHGATTREDLSITDPVRRNQLYGQHDHVRLYGNDGEYERRLRKAGFDVTVIDLAGELGPAATRRYRLRPGEHVYVCRK